MNVTLYRRAADGSVLSEPWRGDRLTRADLADVERIVIWGSRWVTQPGEQASDLDIELPSVAVR